MELKEVSQIRDTAVRILRELYEAKEAALGPGNMRQAERVVVLEVLDRAWRNHLYALDHLKEGMYLRSYANKDPLVEYKKESFALFGELLEEVMDESLRRLLRLREVPQLPRRRPPVRVQRREPGRVPGQKPRRGVPRGVVVIQEETKRPKGEGK